MRLRAGDHTIEPLSWRHLDEFVRYRQVPEIARYQGWYPEYSEADAEELLIAQAGVEFPAAGQWVQFAIVNAETGRLAGDLAVHALADQPDTHEIGITLAPASQGRGIATVALEAVLAYLFTEQASHRVIATSDHRNDSVCRLLKRVGFRHEGTLVDADWFKDEWTTIDHWAMLRGPTRATSVTRP